MGHVQSQGKKGGGEKRSFYLFEYTSDHFNFDKLFEAIPV